MTEPFDPFDPVGWTPLDAFAIVIVKPGEYLDPGPWRYEFHGQRVYMRAEMLKSLADRCLDVEERARLEAERLIERVRAWPG